MAASIDRSLALAEKIPWRDVGIEVASRHGRTTCDPKQRCGNSLALSWIACSLVLVAPTLMAGCRPSSGVQVEPH
jgi:hypothetical protein